MARFNKLSVLAMVAITTVVLLAALMSDVADASTFTDWKLPGCHGPKEQISNCGTCYPIKYHLGYSFKYTAGKSAYLYRFPHCLGPAGRIISYNETRCLSFPWKSIRIKCHH
ncbi:hypothetical protein Syun_019982 [Stephania yunnanensis]|uniref:Uncharacterized protein n=1 Tax=Stephania yunnanensis TaxID=152371 RepID=A0AAP0NYG7_9MAGN